jgi:hypothetical protein
MERINNNIFSKIFKELDSDEDNLITPININLNNLNDEIKRIINPLIEELREDNQTLEENEFIDAMNKLYKELSIKDKHIILNTYKNKPNGNNFNNTKNTVNYLKNSKNKNKKNNINFNNKPKINQKSKKLAKIYDKKMYKKFDNYNKTYNNIDYNKIYYDNNNIFANKNKKDDYFKCSAMQQLNKNNKNNKEFNSICEYTFDNYLKSLN